MLATAPALDTTYTLDDRYRRDRGRILITGIQALVRLPLMQWRLDRARGLTTAGFVSGYRGSPLAGYDQALWQARRLLEAEDVRFEPAVNEALAATAVYGTQQVEAEARRKVDGVFALWYGKGPGVDMAGDAIKHGHAYGSSPRGGVLVVAGDDHGAVSSTIAHQSDQAFVAWWMPVLHPAGIADYLDFGLWGWAASRFSGGWVGFKAISGTVESAATVELSGELPEFIAPVDFT
ncbi:MAG TPA: indolepyruvate ferredoxin oxidoreductase family protein, partial [Geminicoccaceae bacterium]|nr:indolepyruvate ferredoxin oxidoreductase family protein [Geminicoccaceae bacterium]